jgi:pSer/pThr/pTyr-binding forkhead associated (FHA) protein
MSGVVVLIIRALVSLSLYFFLGTALYIIWQELHTQSELARAAQIPVLTISPLNDGDINPVEFTIPEVIVGRDTACSFSIPDETVSSRHARISYHHNQWWVDDMSSTNGTFLNDDRVYTPTVVISGDEIRCGQIVLKVAITAK